MRCTLHLRFGSDMTRSNRDFCYSPGKQTFSRGSCTSAQPEAQHPKSSGIHKLAGRLPHLLGEERKSHRVRRSRSLVSSISTASRSQRPPSNQYLRRALKNPAPRCPRALNSCLVFADEPNRQAAFRWSGDEAQTRSPRATRRRITCTGHDARQPAHERLIKEAALGTRKLPH